MTPAKVRIARGLALELPQHDAGEGVAQGMEGRGDPSGAGCCSEQRADPARGHRPAVAGEEHRRRLLVIPPALSRPAHRDRTLLAQVGVRAVHQGQRRVDLPRPAAFGDGEPDGDDRRRRELHAAGPGQRRLAQPRKFHAAHAGERGPFHDQAVAGPELGQDAADRVGREGTRQGLGLAQHQLVGGYDAAACVHVGQERRRPRPRDGYVLRGERRGGDQAVGDAPAVEQGDDAQAVVDGGPGVRTAGVVAGAGQHAVAVGRDLVVDHPVPGPAIGLQRLPPVVERLAVGAPGLRAASAAAHEGYVHQPGTGRLNEPHVAVQEHGHARDGSSQRAESVGGEHQLGHSLPDPWS